MLYFRILSKVKYLYDKENDKEKNYSLIFV